MRLVTVAELAEAVGGTVRGDGRAALRGMAPLETASEGEASFLARADYRERAAGSAASCLIVSDADAASLAERTLIVVKDPYRAFAHAMRAFHPESSPAPGIHALASVHETATLGEDVHVGASAVVGAGSTVGARSVLLPGAVVGQDCAIGEDCVLHPGSVLYARTRLGRRVVVHARAVIGSDGFGYSSGPDGHVKIPHAGRVVVEDDVEIGAGTCIDRGAMGDTRIGAGTKIDNLVQVGHNVDVGEGCLLVAQSGISGSTSLGRFVVLAGQSGIAGHLTIGDGARIAAKSAVLQDVAAQETVGGIPAMPLASWKRAALLFGRLPDMWRRLRKLEGDTGSEDR